MSVMSGMLDKTDLFKFAAASYLCWWVKNDRDYFGWNDLTQEELKKFLTLYSVRRIDLGNDLKRLHFYHRGTTRRLITQHEVPELIKEACRSVEIKQIDHAYQLFRKFSG